MFLINHVFFFFLLFAYGNTVLILEHFIVPFQKKYERLPAFALFQLFGNVAFVLRRLLERM